MIRNEFFDVCGLGVGRCYAAIRSSSRRLHDAANESLSLESRFDLVYNAAHAMALAALRKA